MPTSSRAASTNTAHSSCSMSSAGTVSSPMSEVFNTKMNRDAKMEVSRDSFETVRFFGWGGLAQEEI